MGGPQASGRAREVATLATRGAKEREVAPETLHERWRAKADEIGLDREAIQRALGPPWETRGRREAAATAEHRTVSSWQVDRAVTAAASHFDRRDAIQAVAGLLREGSPAAEVERIAEEFLVSDAVVPIGRGQKGERFTTKRIWELERTALDTAEKMAAEDLRTAGELIAARVLHTHPTLKTDQREMIKRLLSDPEGLAIAIGEAGTGKSYAILAAAKGWSEAGIDLRVAAPT